MDASEGSGGTGVWNSRRKTTDERECLVDGIGGVFVIAVSTGRFKCRALSGERVLSVKVQTEIGGGRSGTVRSTALQGHE